MDRRWLCPLPVFPITPPRLYLLTVPQYNWLCLCFLLPHPGCIYWPNPSKPDCVSVFYYPTQAVSTGRTLTETSLEEAMSSLTSTQPGTVCGHVTRTLAVMGLTSQLPVAGSSLYRGMRTTWTPTRTYSTGGSNSAQQVTELLTITTAPNGEVRLDS